MGKITDALKKATEDRLERLEKVNRIREHESFVVKNIEGSKIDPRIVAYFDPKAVITEQYRTLRTNILSLNKGNAPKVIVVTSSIHSEGKTITALNLAVSLAKSTKKPKILLIDADLRRGRIAKYLGVEQPQGLTEVLHGEAKLGERMFNVDIENLTFLSAGTFPDHAAELLASEAMHRVLYSVKKEFDHVIIDSPPIISVTDAGILGAQTDGVLMVIQAGRTQRGIVKRAAELLNQAHAKLLGHVLTNVEYHLPEYIYRYL